MAGTAAVIDHDYLAPAVAFADSGDAQPTTGIEDLPADVMSLVLRRLDGASLAALGCASSAFRDLAADPDAWRALCLAAWPSVREAVHLLCNDDKGHGQYYRQLFADAFPFPALPSPATPAALAAHSVCLPERLVSAVDLHHGRIYIQQTGGKKDAGYQAFVVDGWNGYHRKDRLKTHVGDVNGEHYIAMKKCDDLLQRKQHINVYMDQKKEENKRAYFTRLNGSIDTARLLLKQGLAFRGHDESKESFNKGNFLELFDCLAEHDPHLGKAVGRAGNSSSTQVAMIFEPSFG